MAAERYVLLGLAHGRSEWFRSVAQWATSAAIPVEFVKCVSTEELRARLASGRPHSAVIADASLPALDRDLIDRARSAGCTVLVVDDGRVARDWHALGARAVLSGTFGRDDLLVALDAHASMIGRADTVPGDEHDPTTPGWRGRVAAVTGAGGTGVSTVAIALAQGLADDVRDAGLVLLADLRLNAEQAMLHDARDVVPGVQELVEAHRSGRPSLEEVRSLTFHVVERRYHLLLGLRRARFWASIRPRAFEHGFDALCRAYLAVVCDVDGDLEGEDDSGSIEVEERNVMTRTATGRADVVLAVGLPSMKGLHSLVRVLHELADHGVPVDRIVPVVNRAPRAPRARAGLAASLAGLAGPALAGDGLAAPVFVPERRVDDDLRDGVRLPAALTDPVAGAFRAVTARRGQRGAQGEEPQPVRPGSLGRWTDEAEAASG